MAGNKLPEEVAGVLLAAGGGTRFAGSTHKLLAELPGTDKKSNRVIDRSLASLQAAGFAKTAVVTGAVEPWPNDAPAITVLKNPNWAQGIATSLQTAVVWATEQELDAIVVGLADQPFVNTQAWRDVALAVIQTGPHLLAVATYDGVPGNPVGLRRQVWQQLPKTGDEGARVVMRSQPELCLPVACAGNPSDIDTVEDLQKWS